MKLQDILGTEQRYDVKVITSDQDLARQIQVILINLTLLDPHQMAALDRNPPQPCIGFKP